MVSHGKVARSTRSTRKPWRASSIASGEPATRAPTMIVSYMPPKLEPPAEAEYGETRKFATVICSNRPIWALEKGGAGRHT